MPQAIIDETIDPDATATGRVSRSNRDNSTNFAFYLKGDAEAADVDVEFYTQPNGSQWYQDADEDLKNEDITEGRSYRPDTRGSHEVEIRVTNNGNNATDVTVEVTEYHV